MWLGPIWLFTPAGCKGNSLPHATENGSTFVYLHVTGVIAMFVCFTADKKRYSVLKTCSITIGWKLWALVGSIGERSIWSTKKSGHWWEQVFFFLLRTVIELIFVSVFYPCRGFVSAVISIFACSHYSYFPRNSRELLVNLFTLQKNSQEFPGKLHFPRK